MANDLTCSDCGRAIDPLSETPETPVPCIACGGTRRSISASIVESATLRDGLEVKAKRPGQKKPYIEDRGVPSFSRRLKKIVLHERRIDRDNDRYFERVSDYESGEIIHHQEEPLSAHRGHGGAKGQPTRNGIQADTGSPASPKGGAMKCWICGAPATTGEHIPKASTLRDIFGPVSQQHPAFHSSKQRRNRRMQSLDSKLVKFRVLCGQCNSGVTQPFDRAWDAFWGYLLRNGHALNRHSVIRLSRVFGYRARRKALNFHLYAVKLFGCVAAGFSIPLDLIGMADSILRQRTYPHIYVGLGKRNWLKELKFAGPSDVVADKDPLTGECVYAVWFLTVGEWEFQFIYALPGQKRDGLLETWSPNRSRRFRLKEFNRDSDHKA